MSSGGAEAMAAIAQILGPAVGRALGTFFRTLLGMFFLGLVLVIGSFVYAASVSTLHGVLAALACLILSVVAGFVLSAKRAVTGALCTAVDELDLGPKSIELVFTHMLDVEDTDAHGDRGVAAARMLENLPLQQAEARLDDTIRAMLTAPAEGGGLGGWLRRKLLASLLEKIRTLTLAELRGAAQNAGGIDLIRVRDSLGTEIDARLSDLTSSALQKITLVFVAGLILSACLASWGIAQLSL